jgi:hypothetical protein
VAGAVLDGAPVKVGRLPADLAGPVGVALAKAENASLRKAPLVHLTCAFAPKGRDTSVEVVAENL